MHQTVGLTYKCYLLQMRRAELHSVESMTSVHVPAVAVCFYRDLTDDLTGPETRLAQDAKVVYRINSGVT